MITPRIHRLALAAAVVALPALRAGAQGNLSMQGYGYPTGELSSRAIATGGSVGEFDPASPLNPAALGSWGASPINSRVRQWWGRTAFTVQYDPEFRSTDVGNVSSSTKVARFPLVAFSMPLRDRFQLGLSAATLLDRTYETAVPSTTVIDGVTVPGVDRFLVKGSMADVRLAGAMNIGTSLSLGVGAHVITGQNRVVSEREFTDTSQFGAVSDSTHVGFSGIAFSAGAEWRPVRGFSLAGSYKKGGTLRAERGDTLLRKATVPDRLGIGLRVDRFSGTSFTASYATTSWTNMDGLTQTAVRITDSPEYSAGVETVGPRVGPSQLLVRLGARQRTLPFGVDGADVDELSFAGGVSAPFTGGRAVLDLGLQHASRTPNGGTLKDVSERAWTVTMGLTLRP